MAIIEIQHFKPTPDIARTRWLAPEQITSGSAARPTEMADIWSFGSLCLEVFTGREPYSYYSDLKVPLLLGDGIPPENREFTVIGVSTKIWELVQSCWRVNPAERPSMSTVNLTITGILSLDDCE
jgi:serine/threonine protein kinase